MPPLDLNHRSLLLRVVRAALEEKKKAFLALAAGSSEARLTEIDIDRLQFIVKWLWEGDVL